MSAGWGPEGCPTEGKTGLVEGDETCLHEGDENCPIGGDKTGLLEV
jgi:hypothetical protein